MTKIAKLRAMPLDELDQLVAKLKQDLTQLRLEIKLGKVKNTHQKKLLTKQIARIKTIKREKVLQKGENL